MLCVPTFVAPSAIAGVGLHAATDLPAGTVIWEYTEGVDWRIRPEELAAFPEPFRSRLQHYLYQEESGEYVLCGDNAKFMNHSETPNCDDPEGAYTITNRHIRAGEELTCDYRAFDLPSRQHGMEFPEVGAMPNLIRHGNRRARAS